MSGKSSAFSRRLFQMIGSYYSHGFNSLIEMASAGPAPTPSLFEQIKSWLWKRSSPTVRMHWISWNAFIFRLSLTYTQRTKSVCSKCASLFNSRMCA